MADKIQRHFEYGFTMIDNRIFDSKDFDKLTDKFLYMTLIKFSYGKNNSFPSISTLADSCLCARSTLKLSLERLEKKNYIKKEIRTDEKGNNLSNIYHLFEIPGLRIGLGVDRESTEGRPKDDRGIDRESATKNISFEEKELNNIVEIINYLNEKAGTNYKSSTNKTRQYIHSRLTEDFTVDDFKQVIDHMCDIWLKDPKMHRYVRPSTLFGTHFEEYLNESPKHPDKPDKGGTNWDKYK
ncbi:MAG: conserved phage C-terminal domain-containing protein [Sporolactobacillus sp.]